MRYALAFAASLLAGGAHAACSPDRVDFRGPHGTSQFSVEVALTPAQRERGLMDRSAMPATSGMLFVYQVPEHAYFWMKDTLIPLDMIFVDATGTVARVQANAVPQDLSIIDGGDGVAAVVEVNGGVARARGIEPGAQMRTPYLPQATALWPCSSP